jgi:hypothetical protein
MSLNYSYFVNFIANGSGSRKAKSIKIRIRNIPVVFLAKFDKDVAVKGASERENGG